MLFTPDFLFVPVYQPDEWEVDLKNLDIFNSKDVAALGFGSFGKVYLGIARALPSISKALPTMKGYKEIGCAIKVKQNGSIYSFLNFTEFCRSD